MTHPSTVSPQGETKKQYKEGDYIRYFSVPHPYKKFSRQYYHDGEIITLSKDGRFARIRATVSWGGIHTISVDLNQIIKFS